MPNRILRDWTDSETMDQLTVYAERFFTRLIMKVDDYGRFTANPRVLNGNLFILKDDVRDTDITRWLNECETAGLILIYEVNNKKYLQIENFHQTLRIKKEKHPPPSCVADDKQMTSTCVPEKKRNETEKEEGVEENLPPLAKVHFLREPNIPSKQDVLECFIQNGGNKEMAKSFYDSCQSTGWFYKGSPITDFRSRVYSFVENWKKNESKGGNVVTTSFSSRKQDHANKILGVK